jgi:hypothetical protein
MPPVSACLPVGWVSEAQPDNRFFQRVALLIKCRALLFAALRAGTYDCRDAPLRGFPNLHLLIGMLLPVTQNQNKDRI